MFVAAMKAELASLASSEGPDGSRHKAVSKLLRMYSSMPSRAEKRTAAREAWLKKHYPTTLMPRTEMHDVLNGMPGAPLTGNDLANWTHDLKLHRSKEYMSAVGREAGRASVVASGGAPRFSEYRSPEREAYMRAHYPAGTAASEMIAAMNAMPAGSAMTVNDFGAYAKALLLKRPNGFAARNGAIAGRLAQAKRRGAFLGKDGLPSVAMTIERGLLAEQSTCPITLDDALEWGRRNGLRQTLDPETDFARVNEIRRAHSLDLFRLIPPKPRQGPLPRLIHHDARDMR